MEEMMPLSDTIITLMVVRICGRVSASRLHKIVYILNEKYRVPLKLRYESSLSIYSDDLEYDVQIVSRGEYVDRIYRVTEKGLRVLEDSLKDEDAERMFNQLELYIRGLGEMPVEELVALAKTFIRNTIQKI